MALFDRNFYRPTKTVYQRPEDYNLDYRPVAISTADHLELSAWWLPAIGSPCATVVHCHGNGGNITGHFSSVAWMPARGFNVLCFDYRGYGSSAGQVSRAGTIADAHAAIDFAASLPNSDPRTIMLFGQSLGGAVAIAAASTREDIAGVAVDGPFSNYQLEVEWVLRRHWLTRPLARFLSRSGVSRGHEPIECVHAVAPTPLLLMHGKEDRVCPWEMSQDLFERAGEPKHLWLIEGMDHYQALADLPEEVHQRLTGFFETCARARLSVV